MPKFENGLKRAFGEIIGGVITSSLLTAFLKSGVIPWYYVIFIEVAGTIALFLAMKYWGTTYHVGWIFGILLLSISGLVGPVEFVLFLIIPIIIVLIRVFEIKI
jgi:hypothetical protein